MISMALFTRITYNSSLSFHLVLIIIVIFIILIIIIIIIVIVVIIIIIVRELLQLEKQKNTLDNCLFHFIGFNISPA